MRNDLAKNRSEKKSNNTLKTRNSLDFNKVDRTCLEKVFFSDELTVFN